MEQKVLDTIKKYNLIEDGDRVVVGVSGGPDSISLLNILNNFQKNKILVVHQKDLKKRKKIEKK